MILCLRLIPNTNTLSPSTLSPARTKEKPLEENAVLPQTQLV